MKRPQQTVASFIENEKSRIDAINAACVKRRNEIAGTPELIKARAYLEEKAQSYQSFFDRFDRNDEQFDAARTAMRKEIRKQSVRKFPGLLELSRLNAERAEQLGGVLHPGHGSTTHDAGLLADPELVIGDIDYDEFEPPYELQHSELNVGNNFALDDSFPWADWGTLGNYVRFSHDHSWTDFSGGTSRYGYNIVELGVNYRMPTHGALDVTIVLKALDHRVNFQISDNFGTSGASCDVSHMLFFPVKSGGTTKYLHSISLLEARRESHGDNKSGPLSTVSLNTPIIVNFRTDHIHENEDLQIMVASWFRIDSGVLCMKTEIVAASLLKVEKMYLRVVE